MITRILAFFLISGLACSPVAMDQMEKESSRDKVLIYSKGASLQVQEANASKGIVEEATRLFTEADDFYWKAISESDLEGFRQKGCVEVIFANPREIVIQAVKETKTISKLLIPLDEAMCAHDAHIVYGDPDYDTFNLLLNSQGCGELQKLVQKASLTK